MRNFIPERLTEARQEKEYTITELERITNISRVTLSKLENGMVSNPKPETIGLLSLVLNKQTDFFFLPVNRNFKDISVTTFRSTTSRNSKINKSIEVKKRRCQDFIQFLYSYINPRPLNIPKKIIESIANSHNITDSDIEVIALELRKAWNLGLGPITNLVTILENNGIICFGLPNISNTVDSINSTYRFNNIDDDFCLIVYNNNLSYYRQRFSLAHELGHIILHRYWEPYDFEINKQIAEKQAHRFASAFLMPMQTLENSLTKFNLNGAVYAKSNWKVSIQAICKRMCDLKLISENQYQFMNIEISRKGWKKNEPGDDKILPEYPYYIREAFKFLLENNYSSAENIQNYFKLINSEIVDYIGNQEYFITQENLIKFSLKSY